MPLEIGHGASTYALPGPPAEQLRIRDVPMIPILAGGLAGLVHVLSGLDHLAAIAPISMQRQGASWRTGFRWGVGQAGGVLFVCALSLLGKAMLPLSAFSSFAERLVGVALIAIGVWGLRKVWKGHVHIHAHDHNGKGHGHLHVHSHLSMHGREKAHAHTHAAFAVGTLHGFAGSSHFLGVLPALAFTNRIEAIYYLTSFGIGTILAMAFFSHAIGFLAKGSSLKGHLAYHPLIGVCSAVAIGVGSYWLVEP